MTPDDVLRAYQYDPETGTFSWREGARARPPGHTSPKGYLRIRVGMRYYPAHHLVWLVEHGAMPHGQVDHIDGEPSNNIITNLRVVAPVINSQNQRRAHTTSKSGLLGASPSHDKWRAQIKVHGVSVHLGLFSTPEAAHAAYLEAKREMHPGCTI